MMDRRHFLLTLAGLVVAAHSQAQGAGMTPIKAVPAAPTLHLPNGDGKLVDLAQYRGKVVLVIFWATWCPPCRKEFPSMNRVRKLFKSAQFEVIAVNVGEDPDKVLSFTRNIEFPVLFDRDSKVMGAWSVRGLPSTFLVDKQGRLAFMATGGREFDDTSIVSLIKGLL